MTKVYNFERKQVHTQYYLILKLHISKWCVLSPLTLVLQCMKYYQKITLYSLTILYRIRLNDTLTSRNYDERKKLCFAVLVFHNGYCAQSKAYHKLNQMHSPRLGIAHLHCFYVSFALRLGILGRTKSLTLLHPYKGSRAVKALVKSNTKYTRVCEFSRRITTNKISRTGT